MRLFQYLVASSAAVTSYPAFLAKTDVDSLGKSKNRVPISCTSDRDCPAGSACFRLYGKVGLCVVTLPKVV